MMTISADGGPGRSVATSGAFLIRSGLGWPPPRRLAGSLAGLGRKPGSSDPIQLSPNGISLRFGLPLSILSTNELLAGQIALGVSPGGQVTYGVELAALTVNLGAGPAEILGQALILAFGGPGGLGCISSLPAGRIPFGDRRIAGFEGCITLGGRPDSLGASDVTF